MLEPSGKFSAYARKDTDDGEWLTLSLIIDGKIIDTAHTNLYQEYVDVRFQG